MSEQNELLNIRLAKLRHQWRMHLLAAKENAAMARLHRRCKEYGMSAVAAIACDVQIDLATKTWFAYLATKAVFA